MFLANKIISEYGKRKEYNSIKFLFKYNFIL